MDEERENIYGCAFLCVNVTVCVRVCVCVCRFINSRVSTIKRI